MISWLTKRLYGKANGGYSVKVFPHSEHFMRTSIDMTLTIRRPTTTRN